uniref:Uncharacterized protein n=1 Tax=Anophryoides haemophila TaxID=46462 RepID=A0A7S3IBK0_9CILI|mmetsp:Transcript_508/g.97  ORF Transcript_508/g.97 Transcript_508/m.97 type:complete len:121 (+) Transcript_508:172-534(+)
MEVTFRTTPIPRFIFNSFRSGYRSFFSARREFLFISIRILKVNFTLKTSSSERKVQFTTIGAINIIISSLCFLSSTFFTFILSFMVQRGTIKTSPVSINIVRILFRVVHIRLVAFKALFS